MKASRAWRVGGLAAALVVGVLAPISGCGQTESPGQKGGQSPAAAELVQSLGAAARVPEDVSAYIAVHDLAGQWRRIWDSTAVRRVFILPVVQQFWMQAQMNPDYVRFLHTLRTHPIAVQGMAVLGDGLDNEVFVCTGPDLPDTLDALRTLHGEMTLAGMKADASASAEEVDITPVLEAMLAHEKVLRMPSVLIGFRVTDSAAARAFLETCAGLLADAPTGWVAERNFGGEPFSVLDLSGKQLPEDVMADIVEGMTQARMPTALRDGLVDFVRSQRLVLAVGVLDDHLLISMGRDTSLLERWGEGPSLAASDEFDPIRANSPAELLSISYSSSALGFETITPQDIEQLADFLISEIPPDQAPPQLIERLRKDMQMLAGEIVVPERFSTLAFTVENQGVESFVFRGPFPPSLDHSQSLSILAHRSQHPFVAMAARAAKNAKAYEQLVNWLKVVYGYVQDFGVPQMQAEERAEYEKLTGVAIPFLSAFDAATREHLIPAIDGTQSLQLIDGRGELAGLPGEATFPRPLPIPRVGVAIELNDAEQFRKAMSRYAEAIRLLLSDIHNHYPTSLPSGFILPDPVRSKFAGGTLYQYPIPGNLGPDLTPCALLKDRLLIIATSTRLAEAMIEEQPLPDCPITKPQAAAGAVTLVEFDALHKYLERLSQAGLAMMQAQEYPPDPQMVFFFKMHADAFRGAIGTLKSYRSTLTEQDGRAVTHSWLHVEDIKP